MVSVASPLIAGGIIDLAQLRVKVSARCHDWRRKGGWFDPDALSWSMLNDTLDQLHLPQRRNVRLDTLLRLRWLAIIGQSTAVLVVHYGLDFPLPIWACLAVIALSAWLNVALRVRFAQPSGWNRNGLPGCSPSTSPSSRCCCS